LFGDCLPVLFPVELPRAADGCGVLVLVRVAVVYRPIVTIPPWMSAPGGMIPTREKGELFFPEVCTSPHGVSGFVGSAECRR